MVPTTLNMPSYARVFRPVRAVLEDIPWLHSCDKRCRLWRKAEWNRRFAGCLPVKDCADCGEFCDSPVTKWFCGRVGMPPCRFGLCAIADRGFGVAPSGGARPWQLWSPSPAPSGQTMPPGGVGDSC